MYGLRSSFARVSLVLPAASLRAVSFRALSVSRASILISVPRVGVASVRSQSFRRLYSVLSHSDAKIYNYDDVKAYVAAPGEKTLLVDVREPAEYAEGHIPGAVNIPFKSSPGAFGLSNEDFKESFGFEKPSKDTELIFYCLAGVRSTSAEELANSFGYAKRGNYPGSYEDWVTQENAQT